MPGAKGLGQRDGGEGPGIGLEVTYGGSRPFGTLYVQISSISQIGVTSLHSVAYFH